MPASQNRDLLPHEATRPAPSRTRAAAAAPPAVEARRLVRLFGSTPALLGVDLAIPRGTVCALVGGNGAGKTTLLRIVATALRPTSGTALVHGLDVRERARRIRRDVDVAFASGGFYPELSGAENLRFALAMRGDDQDRRAIESALARAGLAREANTQVRALSAGMTRRLALARLMLTRPRLVLIDEPYVSLDAAGRELVDELLAEVRAGGRTALLATHERERAQHVADLTVELRGGTVAAVSRPARPELPARERAGAAL